MYDVKKLGRALRRHREAARLTQEELADKTGLNNKKISRMEAGGIEDPGFRDLIALADALGMSPNTIAEMAGVWAPSSRQLDWDDPQWEWLQSWLHRAADDSRGQWLRMAYAAAIGLEQARDAPPPPRRVISREAPSAPIARTRSSSRR